MRSIRFTEKTLTRALTAGVLMGSLFLPFSAGAASPERTAESKSVPAATVSAQEKVSQEKIVKENLKIAGTALCAPARTAWVKAAANTASFLTMGGTFRLFVPLRMIRTSILLSL